MSDYLTLTEFRATGSDATADEMEAAAGTDLEGSTGRVYKFGTYIERMTDMSAPCSHGFAQARDCGVCRKLTPAKPGEEWCLTIMNDSWAGPLSTLEALLYSFVRTEVIAHLPHDAEYRALIEEWETFCVDEKLEAVSADEMPLGKLTPSQASYVRWFIDRWEVMTMRQEVHGPAYTAEANETLRQALIQWLIWNDRNGCYSDEQCANEGLDPLTLQGALQLVTEQLK